MAPGSGAPRKGFGGAPGSGSVQRRDLVIVLVGALLVLGATAYAAVEPAGGLGGRAYSVTYATASSAMSLRPTGGGPTTGAMHVTATEGVKVLNLTHVHVEARVRGSAGTPLAPTATMHASLAMPNGTKLERDAAPTAGGSEMSLAFDVEVSPTPPNATIQATGDDDAWAHLAPPSTLGQGNWTITLDVSAFPSTVSGFDIVVKGNTTAYHATVAPAPPAAK